MDVTIPAIGESITEGILGRWLVDNGSWVEEGTGIYELETDKVSSEVTAEISGVIEFLVEEGETVAVGSAIARIDPDAEKPAAAPQSDPPAAAPPEPATDAEASAPAPVPTTTVAETASEAPISPAARKLIDEHGLTAASIVGTGRKGTITKGDVLTHIEDNGKPAAATPVAMSPPGSSNGPSVSVGPVGPAERKAMTPLRRRIAQRLVNAQRTAAILTTFNEVDMQPVMQLRKKHKEAFAERHGTGLGFMSFFTKAAVAALQTYPLINSFIDGDDLIIPEHVNMGIAVGTDRGLVVPVLREAEQMDFADIERSIRAHAKNAREGKMTLQDMEGGTFTITNGGVYGSMMSTPILNPPQSGILGMHAIQERPVARNGEVVIRPMMYIALSYDHRIVDGAEAVGFLVRIKELIEDPDRLLLDL